MAIAAISFVYLKGSGAANNINQGFADDAENKIMGFLKDDAADNHHPNESRWLWQALIIIVSGMLSASAITRSYLIGLFVIIILLIKCKKN